MSGDIHGTLGAGGFGGLDRCPAFGGSAASAMGAAHPVGPVEDRGPQDRAPREGVDLDVLEFAQKLFQLARDGETEQLAAYVDAGVTVDLTNERGDAFLMLAAYNGQPETVRMLLGKGAEVDRANDRGQTPLAGAVFKGHGEIVRMLFEAGADPQAGTPNAVDTARMFEKDAFLELFGV